jgi:hypothetical protein
MVNHHVAYDDNVDVPADDDRASNRDDDHNGQDEWYGEKPTTEDDGQDTYELAVYGWVTQYDQGQTCHQIHLNHDYHTLAATVVSVMALYDLEKNYYCKSADAPSHHRSSRGDTILRRCGRNARRSRGPKAPR